MPEKYPETADIRLGYDQVTVKQSSAADVLSVIRIPEHEILSQSKSTIVFQGEKKKGKKMWLKMVGFDEDTLTAQRKYFFVEDEIPKVFFTEPLAGATFQCEVVLDKKVLDRPYSSENARRVAVLKHVLESFRSDIKEVQLDNKMIELMSMMVNQAMETVLTKLDKSPGSMALSVKLDDVEGLDFNHINYNKGKIGMIIECDEIAKVQVMLGSFIRYFEDNPIEKRQCFD